MILFKEYDKINVHNKAMTEKSNRKELLRERSAGVRTQVRCGEYPPEHLPEQKVGQAGAPDTARSALHFKESAVRQA